MAIQSIYYNSIAKTSLLLISTQVETSSSANLKTLINISVESLDEEDLSSDNIDKDLDNESESINMIEKFISTTDMTLSYSHLDSSTLNTLLNHLSHSEINISISSNYN